MEAGGTTGVVGIQVLDLQLDTTFKVSEFEKDSYLMNKDHGRQHSSKQIKSTETLSAAAVNQPSIFVVQVHFLTSM